MRPRFARRTARAWGAGACAATLAITVPGCLNLEQLGRLLAGGSVPSKDIALPLPDASGPPKTYAVTFRVGELWDASDGRLEIYDRRRWLWLDVRDPGGKPPLEPPMVAVRGPQHLAQPQVYEVQKDQSGDRFFVRVRFYDPGAGYRLVIQTRTPSGTTESVAFDLPEVGPAVRRAGDFSLAYTASPSFGRPLVPALLTVRAADPAGAAATLGAPPRVRLTNPCGWGPIGTFSAVPGEAGAYAFEVPRDEIIEVTGNYKVKVYPLSDQASYVEYTYETR